MIFPRLKTFAVALGTSGVLTTTLLAQQGIETRGHQLSFGVNLGFETQSNRALDPARPGSSTSATAALSMGLLRQTKTQRLSFDLGGEMRHLDSPTNDDSGFHNPSIKLSYDRDSANARLSLSGSLRETDLADEGLVFDETSQEFVFAEGTATRRSTRASAQLNWRDDAPLGFGVSASLAENRYRGGVATGIDGLGLNDTRRMTIGTSGRLDLNEVSQLNIGLDFSRFEDDGNARDRDTWTLTNALNIERPNGVFSLNLNVTDTEDGTRVSSAVGRSLDYPLGTLSGQIGATSSTAGKVYLTGSLDVLHELPRGNLTFGIARNVNSSTLQDTEQVSTSVTFGHFYELNSLSNLSINARWAELSRTGGNSDTTSARLVATYSRELTPDWNMNLGVQHRQTHDATSGTVRSNGIFLNVERNFVTRF
ncbi:hypothetical protein OO012_14510 [Rhodobacteraceae bacterium KMM 6894]|nr:hypothetical protein [Rhodobacteraceae bacterium KMM 6894]